VPVRIGLLGAGFMGSTHAAAYEQIENAEVVAVGDANQSLADETAAKYGAKAYYDIESLVADAEVDAVDVCLPTFLHERAVVAAARNGKHVICEKPLALSLDQADQMIEAVETSGVSAMVAQVIRFWPEYVAIRELVQQGSLGEPRAIMAMRLSPPPAWGDWFKDPSLSGGALLDLHVHDLDFVYSLLGMPETVYAVGLQSETGAWDYVQTSLSYRDASAVIEGTFLMPDSFPFQMLFRLHGSEATAEYRFRVVGQVEERAQAETELKLYRSGEPASDIPSSRKDAYLAEVEYFVECLASDRKPEIATLYEARDVLSIAMAARRSLETGEPVRFG